VQGSTAEFLCGPQEFGRSVCNLPLDLPVGRLELLAKEIHTSGNGIDDVPVLADLGASAELEIGKSLDGVGDVF
jgi:hypothetical protein